MTQRSALSGNALRAWIRALDAMKRPRQTPELTFPTLVREIATIHGARPALIGERGHLTYGRLVEQADGYAHWAIAQGLGSNDVICLLMRNCPEYVSIWLGLTQVGCTVALINTNLVGDALRHCLSVAAPARVIVATDMLEVMDDSALVLPASVQCWSHGEGDTRGLPRIDLAVAQYQCSAFDRIAFRRPTARDRALLIYTSGTTGLPKAANVSHGRLLEWSLWFAAMMDVQPTDRLFNCLPMYHSTGGVVAIGAVLTKGASVVIRARFSARRLWDDVVEQECTIFLYIGELCRYLASSPPHPRETRHRLRLCCGNGLRGDVWEVFQRRFLIPRILEFYAATEGSISLYNIEERPGAIGRVPPFLEHRFPLALIKCDQETGAPLRDHRGLCIHCVAEEAGEAIGKITDSDDPYARRFDGYTDNEASKRKLLRDVFVPGDRWFRTGDLMRKDRQGYYYFVDRIGDTFRWKGENVSTSEVASVITTCPGVTGAAVYGVAVPGNEGKAGMAALTTAENFTLAVLHRHLVTNLPEYARPLFVRLCGRLDVTGTFKLAKGRFIRDGYSLAAASDTIWFNDHRVGAFVRYDHALLDQITHPGGRSE